MSRRHDLLQMPCTRDHAPQFAIANCASIEPLLQTGRVQTRPTVLLSQNCAGRGMQLREQGIRIKIIVFLKNGAKEQNIIRKGSDCAAAKAANVYNYKHNQRLADVSAISKSRFRDWEPFFCKSKFIMRMPCDSGVLRGTHLSLPRKRQSSYLFTRTSSGSPVF